MASVPKPRTASDANLDTPKSSTEKAFQRAYRACVNCRKQKVKCDLGSIEAPNDPPCARCRRERKECLFLEDRRGGTKPLKRHRTSMSARSASNGSDASPSFDTGAGRAAENATLGRAASPSSEERNRDASDPMNVLSIVAGMVQSERNGNNQETLSRSSARFDSAWSSQRFVQENIIDAQQAREYVLFFYRELFTYFPFVSRFGHDPEAMSREPMLCMTIITIASRYHTLSNYSGQLPQSCIHERCFDVMRVYLEQLMWCNSSMQLFDCIEALLLFVQWIPKAVHWLGHERPDHAAEVRVSSDYRTVNSVVKRLDSMSWRMLGMAIRLASELGPIKEDQSTNASRQRRVLVACFLSEQTLSVRLGRSSTLLDILPRTRDQGAQSPLESIRLELARLNTTAQQMLFLDEATTKRVIDSQDHLRIISWLDHSLHTIMDDISILGGLDKTLLLIDCYYSELYFKSIAYRAHRGRAGNAAGANGKLVFDCVEKAKLLLTSAILDKSPQGRSWLKFAPVRYYHRLIYSCVMLIKVLRDPDWSMLLVNSDILAILESTVTLLFNCAPDELHLSRRYSILLGRLSIQRRSLLTTDSLIAQLRPAAVDTSLNRNLPQTQQIDTSAILPGNMVPGQTSYPAFGLQGPYVEHDPAFTLDFLDTLLSGQGQGWA
ncbi:hypothetical protein BCR37DRAFT_393580 [Protomyces lactucae-debilis]|uniref:Zn(2)-C6 fungal-type domain-containing protein n=1 Tax=Protomyces lactucae-debilis TaxID=2754530 RepID=A0A1Y2FC82_PROLT|nr:uncharacterized protein BCR37DRAFT_393580 [Protomyces lactucae-debilis]ORY80936.1 hypothetical protein BCR37DRAFT_393580 [Protomyces lactucae-debilis]